MRRLSSVLFAASISVSLAACAIDDVDQSSADQADTGELGLHGQPEHVMHDKGEANKSRPQSSPNLTFHGGPILNAVHTDAIFWGPEWGDGTTAFAGDKVSGLEDLFNGFGGTGFANTNTEYTGSNGAITNGATYLGKQFDGTAAPNRALTVTSAVAEACKITGNAPDPAAVYFIYTSTGAGHVSYCAWHSAGTCANGAHVQVAYMPNIDNIGGCDPTDTWTTHSEPLAALANVTAHELSEAITDPSLNAWYDGGGSENADKCAWHWDHAVTLSNGTTWKLQMNWSNLFYNAGTVNGGVRGCAQER